MHPFAGLRIVAAMAPKASFGGHDYDMGVTVRDSFARLGATILEFSLDDWAIPKRRHEIIAKARDFSPHFGIGFPNAGYGLQAQDGEPGSDDADNLFADMLSVPLVLNWDHILTQAPQYYLLSRMDEVRSGAIRTLRHRLGHPMLRHYSPDTGHIAAFERLGILEPGRSKHYFPGARDHFVEAGRTVATPETKGRVGFAGNIYAARGEKLAALKDPVIRELDEAILRAKRDQWTRSGWDLLLDNVARAPEDEKKRLGLDPDYAVFWMLALEVLGDRVSTAFRLEVLGSISQPIDFVGNFADPRSSEALANFDNIRYCGSADFVTQLPQVYRSHEIWVDATNTPFIRGCGAKAIDCFAAGSMMLIDYREDLRANIGELADSFMYRSKDELREMIAYYLSHQAERVEVVGEMQAIIRERLTYRHHFERVCADMATEIGVTTP